MVRLSSQPREKFKGKRVGSPFPVYPHEVSDQMIVSDTIIRVPNYAVTGIVPDAGDVVKVFDIDGGDTDAIIKIRKACRLAKRVLSAACDFAAPGISTDDIDVFVFQLITEAGAYPSTLNYLGYPKSVCTSVNEVACHGIPDKRPLQDGDVLSIDVACYLNGFHGDTCATVIIDGGNEDNEIFERAAHLVSSTKAALSAGIEACQPGGCLSDIGEAIHVVADAQRLQSTRDGGGHGIHSHFHCAPLVKNFRNRDKMELLPGMIFTIEPILTEGHFALNTWKNGWTRATVDFGLAAQFEETVLVTNDGADILTTA